MTTFAFLYVSYFLYICPGQNNRLFNNFVCNENISFNIFPIGLHLLFDLLEGINHIHYSLFSFLGKCKKLCVLIVCLLVLFLAELVMEKSLRPEADWSIICFCSALFIRKVLLWIEKHSLAA